MFVGSRDLQIWTNHNLRETVSGFSLTHRAAGFNLQVGEIELCSSGQRTHGCGVASGNCGEQEFLGRPSSFQPAKFSRRGEMDCVWGGIGLRQTGSARRPPCCDSIRVFFTHEL